ncbi:hypothetical protein JAAARDRAFT_205249 [Jaapia argillacea MUCL 33604]|uniref:Uncharacterized protein n=1 Tax=Jaapia argillacea MUCL 33604 TaxID=933084 RepID=A0A067Q287_9AGAM|nr:hypothetical protein JAAARDRAFT_205249 [Jaapia argillacea MUCL 33604]
MTMSDSHGSTAPPQLNEPAYNPPHPQSPRCHSFQADSVGASRASVVTTSSAVTHESIQGDAATYHLREIGTHTKAFIGKASRGFASLLLGILGRVVNTVDNSDNDREIDPSQGVAEHHTVNDDDLPLDSPRSSVTAISWPDVEHDTTRLFSVNSSTNVAYIGGNSQSLCYCATCRRSFNRTCSIQSGSSRSSDGTRSQQDHSVNATVTWNPSVGTNDRPCMPTAPSRVNDFLSIPLAGNPPAILLRIVNVSDQATPSYNSPPANTPSDSRWASSLTPRNSVVPPGAGVVPRPTGQHYSVRQPTSAPSRITIGTSYRHPPTIEHSRLTGTPASLLHQFI